MANVCRAMRRGAGTAARESRVARRHIDELEYRAVLSSYPTGVAVITAIGRDGEPAGMAVGSFTSVSIEPPLVAFYPAKTSSSFPKIREAKGLCVNVLAADQERVCRRFAATGGNRFRRIDWAPSPVTGAPVLDGAVAWLDCTLEQVADAGDHLHVLARVHDLGARGNSDPLVFHRGAYGTCATNATGNSADVDILEQLRVTDNVRSRLERLADECGVQAVAVGTTRTQMVILASVGRPHAGHAAVRVGDRLPLVAPVGGQFVAWRGQATADEWIARRQTPVSEADRRRYCKQLATLRERGWSLAVEDDAHEELQRSIVRRHAAKDPVEHEALVLEHILALSDQYDPPPLGGRARSNIQLLSAPIFDAAGNTVIAFSLWGLPPGVHLDTAEPFAEPLIRLTAEATADIGGRAPAEHPRVTS